LEVVAGGRWARLERNGRARPPHGLGWPAGHPRMTVPRKTNRPTTAASAARQALKDAPRPWATWVLVGVNVAVWLWMALTGIYDADGRFAWGANYPPASVDQPWRLMTSGFLHAGLFHVLFNMLALVDLGSVLERAGGVARLLLVYASSLLGAGVASMAWSPALQTVGASGAILGLGGSLFVSAPTVLGTDQDARTLRKAITLWLVLIFALGLFLPIDNAAHAGGFATGATIGVLFPLRGQRRSIARRTLATASVAALLSLGLWVGHSRVFGDPIALARVHYLRGLRLLDAGQPGPAREELDRSIAHSPEPAFYRLRARARLRAGDLDGARADRDAAMGTEDTRWVPYARSHAVELRQLRSVGSPLPQESSTR